VYLGPGEHLVKPRSYNPKGTWEHKIIHSINESILSRLGGSWHTPPDLPPGWEHASELADLRKQAQMVIQQDFAAAEIWGWKDPRTCLTLPFWQQLLPPMRYVICSRSPLDVARSLNRFIGCTLEKGLYLWLVYNRSILEHTTGQPQLWVSYEDLIGNWPIELQRLSQFLAKPELAEQPELQNAVQEFIDENLWHHRTFSKGLSMVLQIHEGLIQKDMSNGDLDRAFQEAIDLIGPEATRKEAWKRQVERDKWMEQLRLTRQELVSLIPLGECFILVDEAQWDAQVVEGWRVIPFLERNGQYWGSPADDHTAICEFERLRRSGPRFMVFGWPAFWWLDYFTELNRHLRSLFRCVLHNDRLVVFDLRS
jgi:hypothetical protein